VKLAKNTAFDFYDPYTSNWTTNKCQLFIFHDISISLTVMRFESIHPLFKSFILGKGFFVSSGDIKLFFIIVLIFFG